MEILPVASKEKFTWPSVSCSFIRTSSPKNNNSFFHAMNTVMKDFRESNDDKEEFIKDQRQWLFDQINIQDWWTIQQGQFALLQLSQIFIVWLSCLFDGTMANFEEDEEDTSLSCLGTEEVKNWKPILEVIALKYETFGDIWKVMFPPLFIRKEFISHWVEQCPLETTATNYADIFKNHLLETSHRHVLDFFKKYPKFSQHQRQQVIQTTESILCELYKKLVPYVFDLHRRQILMDTKKIKMETIMGISPYLPYDILFLNAETREVFADTRGWFLSEENPVIILLYYPSISHYENCGQLSGQSKICRVFSSDNEWIQYLRSEV